MNERAVSALQRAYAARQAGNKTLVAALAKVAFEAEPSSQLAFALWSRTLREHDQVALCIDACWRHLALVPTNIDAWLALSRAHEALGNLSRAVSAARRASRLAPENDDVRQQLAHLRSRTAPPAPRPRRAPSYAEA